jgi:hypothetical protein
MVSGELASALDHFLSDRLCVMQNFKGQAYSPVNFIGLFKE